MPAMRLPRSEAQHTLLWERPWSRGRRQAGRRYCACSAALASKLAPTELQWGYPRCGCRVVRRSTRFCGSDLGREGVGKHAAGIAPVPPPSPASWLPQGCRRVTYAGSRGSRPGPVRRRFQGGVRSTLRLAPDAPAGPGWRCMARRTLPHRPCLQPARRWRCPW